MTKSYGYDNISHLFQDKNSIDLEIIKQIKDNFNFCIEDIFSQIFKKMEEDNDFKNQNYTLIRSDNLDIIINEIETLIKKKIDIPSDIDNNLLNFFKPHIYGSTPLFQVFRESFKIFSLYKNNYSKKILIVITDGESSDGDPTNYVIQESEKNDVYIIGCFISIGQYSKNTFYDVIPLIFKIKEQKFYSK